MACSKGLQCILQFEWTVCNNLLLDICRSAKDKCLSDIGVLILIGPCLCVSTPDLTEVFGEHLFSQGQISVEQGFCYHRNVADISEEMWRIAWLDEEQKRTVEYSVHGGKFPRKAPSFTYSHGGPSSCQGTCYLILEYPQEGTAPLHCLQRGLDLLPLKPPLSPFPCLKGLS